MNKKNAIFFFLFAGLFLLACSVSGVTCPTGTNEDNGICIPTNSGLPDPAGGVSGVVANVMLWILGILAAFAIIGFVISGIQYLLSAGDDKRMQAAKRNMTYCIIGVVIGLAGYIVIVSIDTALRGTSTTF